MSLDVYLTLKGTPTFTPARIFIREGGQNREISRPEWEARFPDREPVTLNPSVSEEVFSYNITHNLNKMAAEAGLYEPLWRPAENGITQASQLIEPLRAGLALLKSNPAHFEAFNPSNGWGSYAGLVAFVTEYLAACEEYPEAEVSASR